MGDGPKTYQLLIQVLAQERKQGGKRKQPIGLYRLDNIGPLSIHLRGNNGVYLGHQNHFKARASASGLVLISEYTTSPPRVEGAVFFLALRGAGSLMMTPMGLPLPIPGAGVITDQFPLVTFLYEP